MLKSHYNVKLRHNQQVKRDLMPVAWFLKNVAELPQVIIDYIMELVRTRTGTNYRLKVLPLRRLQLTLPPTFQQFELDPLTTISPYRSYNEVYADSPLPYTFPGTLDPPTRVRYGILGPVRLGYGSFQ